MRWFLGKKGDKKLDISVSELGFDEIS